MNAPRSGCPINLTLEALGDRWSLIVIRDLMFGNRRHFRELLTRSEERIASNILADRRGAWRKPDWYPVATIRASITESSYAADENGRSISDTSLLFPKLCAPTSRKIVPHQSGSGKLKAHS